MDQFWSNKNCNVGNFALHPYGILIYKFETIVVVLEGHVQLKVRRKKLKFSEKLKIESCFSYLTDELFYEYCFRYTKNK